MLGGLCALALRESRVTRLQGVVITVAAVVGMSTVIELAQLRPETAVGYDIGRPGRGRGGRRCLRHASEYAETPRDWVIPALGLWRLAIVLEAWTPPVRRPRRWGRVLGVDRPVLGVLPQADIYTLADIVVQTLRYLPLGAVLAVRFRWKSGWRVAAIGLGVGLVVEAGQFFLKDRTPMITDALSAAVGAWLGFAMAKHAASMLGPADETRSEASYSYAQVGRATTRPALFRPGPAGTMASAMHADSRGTPGGPRGPGCRRAGSGTSSS